MDEHPTQKATTSHTTDDKYGKTFYYEFASKTSEMPLFLLSHTLGCFPLNTQMRIMRRRSFSGRNRSIKLQLAMRETETSSEQPQNLLKEMGT